MCAFCGAAGAAGRHSRLEPALLQGARSAAMYGRQRNASAGRPNSKLDLLSQIEQREEALKQLRALLIRWPLTNSNSNKEPGIPIKMRTTAAGKDLAQVGIPTWKRVPRGCS